MNVINLLIKPASSACNLRCKYCFYLDISHHRETASYGQMTVDTMETLIKEVFAQNPKAVVLAFQGGEPTLVGREFYENVVQLIDEYNKQKITVSYSIQTNGVLIDPTWCQFFKKNNFLVGVSLDGPKLIHDRNRVDTHHNGTFIKVINNIELLKKYQVDFNILTVVNNDLVKETEKIYRYFLSHEFYFLQFIPCLSALGEDQGKALSKENYEIFLNQLFDLWYEDIIKSKPVSIRYFDNLMMIMLGLRPQTCDLNSQCSDNLIIESNGDVYPCDFYVLDEYKIGNINDGLSHIMTNSKRVEFINSSKNLPSTCIQCEFYTLCRGGCKRHRNVNIDHYNNYFCQSYYNFFKKNINRLEQLAFRIKVTG